MSATITPAAADAVTAWVDDFAGFDRDRPAREPAAVRALRRRAIERFGVRGFPGRREEEWRFTDVSAIAATASPAPPGRGAVDAGALAPSRIDGAIAPGLRRRLRRPRAVGPRGAAGGDPARQPGRRARRSAGAGRASISAATPASTTTRSSPSTPPSSPTACSWRCRRGRWSEAPIHLVFYSTAGSGEAPPASFPRTLIVAGEASQATVVETYVGAATPSTSPAR